MAFAAALLVALTLPAGNATASVSGEPMPTGNLDGWRHIFSEDFNTDVPAPNFPGGAYNDKWAVYPNGWWDATKRSMTSNRVLSASGGMLNWNFHSHNGIRLNAAAQPKLNGRDPYNGITYGRFTVRFKSTDTAPGYGQIFLIWPDNDNWPDEGEMDFPAGELNGPIGFTNIRANPRLTRDNFRTAIPFTSWHTGTTEWRPGEIRYILDGRLLGRMTIDTPTTPHHWVLQTGIVETAPTPSLSETANIHVDWISAWSYSPGTSASDPGTAGPVEPHPTRKITRVRLARHCKRSRAKRVSGRIKVRFDRRARHRVLRLNGRRKSASRSIDTNRFRNGKRRIAVSYKIKKRGHYKRYRRCAWIRIAN